MKEPVVSITVVNWNRADDLRECLESLINQTYKNIEIIVVDNHSTDNSGEMIRNEFPQVKFIIMPDSSYGACETFNIGCANAKGEYIIFMDNDALLEKSWIQKAMKEFENDSTLGAVAGRVLNYYTKRDWGLEVYGVEKEYAVREFYTTVFVGCSAMVKKSTIEKDGFYPNDFFIYHNEFVLGAKIVNNGYKIKYCPSCISYHKVSGIQRMSKRSYYYGTRNWYLYIWQYYPFNLAIKHTLIHFVISTYNGIRFPITYLKATFNAISRLPSIITKRNPIKSKNVLKPLRW